MSGPPKDIPASELFLKLCEIPRPSEVVDFPRVDPDTGKPVCKIRIQVLTMVQHDEARIRAFKKLKKGRELSAEDMESSLLREVCGDRVAREVLAMSCLHEKPIKGTVEAGSPRYGKFFNNVDELDNLTADELMVLFSTYEIVQHRFGPNRRTIDSDEELNAWIERLKDGASVYPLAGQSWHQLANLCFSLVERVSALSGHLESQSESLQHISDAQKRNWAIGTGLFGQQRAETMTAGQDLSSNSRNEAIPKLPNEPITTEEAAAIGRRLFGKT
jgi:hypothetical protein